MLLLRVTIPVDFYTSPILIEVDGVNIGLKVLGTERKPSRTPGTRTPREEDTVPNTVDLAQSFLETQPRSERQKLEDALAAETQDLGASVSVSDDGSEEDSSFGTGQPLSLPTFLADFLQGIVNRTQVRIKGVTFQLDLDVPVDPSSSNSEPVSFQLALEGINVEGVTTQSQDEDGSPSIVPKEGKRHISLSNIRAYLISEANVFSALVRSPSMTSPSVASSPAMTRNPPSRETTGLNSAESHNEAIDSLNQSINERLAIADDILEQDLPLADSEEALAIPYEFSASLDDASDDSPATPRASMYHEMDTSPEEAMFHSTVLPTEHISKSTAFEDKPQWASFSRESRSTSSIEPNHNPRDLFSTRPEIFDQQPQTPDSEESEENLMDDLTQSHVYTHEEAESMYLSAFSNNDAQSTSPSPAVSQQISEAPAALFQESPDVEQKPKATRSLMPGGWDDDYSPEASRASIAPRRSLRTYNQELSSKSDSSGSECSSPAFSRASIAPNAVDNSSKDDSEPVAQQDDVATPRGPTRLVKEILSLKNISIYVPSQHRHIQVQPTTSGLAAHSSQSLNRSVYPQAPGAFSVHSTGPVLPRDPAPPPAPSDNVLEVALSPISIHIDASLGILLAMVVGKLLEALNNEKPTPSPQQSHDIDQEEPKKAPEIKVVLEEISFNFLNRLGGVADTLVRYLDPSAFIMEREVLLNATFQKLTFSTKPIEVPIKITKKGRSSTETATLTKIDLEKFRFGYADDDIISFDRERTMATSIRDTFLTTGTDIGVNIFQAGGTTKTEIETLPLVVTIDLQRLDETFSWFGGLSSFLNMSASIASSPSPTTKIPPTVPQKPRGVRFDTPIDPEDKSAASDNKVNARFGGTRFELVGRDCSVTAETSAVKLVSRDEGIGIACSRFRILGPFLKNSRAEPAITAEVGGIRLDFLMAPQDTDLERLLELIIPSKVKFDHGNDEIMVDTLLRQRRKGSVLRANIDTVNVRIHDLAQLSVLPNLGEELAKLSTVAKYLPEDDRPGLLTLGSIQKVSINLDFGGKIGHFGAELREFQVGHITVPSLIAIAIHGISVKRNRSEELVSSLPSAAPEIESRGPVIMARMIGDEIDPVVKLKLQDMDIEYRVPTIMDLLDLAEDATPQDFEASLAASVANLGDQAHTALSRQPPSPREKTKAGKPLTLDIGFRDCLLGLNPLGQPSKMAIVLTDAHLNVALPKEERTSAILDISKASILLIDDIAAAAPVETASIPTRRRVSSSTSRLVIDMCTRGYADICYISSAKAMVEVIPEVDGEKQVNVDFKNDLLVLQTCADSTQTLISLANALKPPTPPSKENKFRTNVMPVQDLLASISAEAFGRPEGEYDFDQDFAGAQEMAGSGSDGGRSTDSPLQINSQYYQGAESELVGEELFDATSSSILAHETTMKDTNEGVLLTTSTPAPNRSPAEMDDLSIHEDYYGRSAQSDSRAKVWNWGKNTYDRAPDDLVKRSPLKISVRDVHFMWNLFDGYDWHHTREVISKAVHDVETKAFERQAKSLMIEEYEEEEIEDDEAIGDFLFNSIYIGISPKGDPNDLSRAINEGLNDNATETESVATTTFTTATGRTARPHQSRSKRLKLKRSKRHKITFDLEGVNVDMIVYPSQACETMNSIDVRVENLNILDHVPTSTWKKFATYDQDMGEREMGTSMVHLQLLNVKPLPELGAAEIVLRATVLPLRLHVDQDALDFITRFFEFKDDNVPVHTSPSDVPFLQRAEIDNIPVQLDFKPKRVDYAGLRSGHTTEFMNFIVLQEARMTLRHVIIYGVSGFDRLGKTLNDIWSPDVKANQLPGVLAGLAPVRSIVNVGSGFKDLVEIPIREYKKDGRVIRSISRGAAAFARTTGTELVKLGAKLAVGTQYALQGAEEMLTDQRQTEETWEDDDLDEEDRRQISLYADQPTGVISGIRGGYRSLARDVNLARDAIIAVPGEVMGSQSASGAARAVWKRAPTIIFRPAMGVTKVIGQTLLGATNSIDPHNRRRIDEVSFFATFKCPQHS